MSAEDYEVFKMLDRQQSQRSENCRETAYLEFGFALYLARHAGMELFCHSECHYSLRYDGWVLNIYPGNQRLYHDKNKKQGPFLNIKNPWGLIDVVEAAIWARFVLERHVVKGMDEAIKLVNKVYPDAEEVVNFSFFVMENNAMKIVAKVDAHNNLEIYTKPFPYRG